MNRRWKIAATLAATACLATAAVFAFYAPAAWAALTDTSLATVGSQAGLSATPLPIMVARAIRVILGVLGIILVVLIIYAGFLYLTDGGEGKKVEKAKAIIKNAVIGLVIVVSSFAITTFILNRLLAAMGVSSGVATSGVNYTEPLSGSLGSGIIESHYPARNATDVPRNTFISVTFKEPIDPTTIASGYSAELVEAGTTTFDLRADNILIYPSATADDGIDAAKLAGADVAVSVSTDFQSFTFNPDALLGSSTENINYTVMLGPDIQKMSGGPAFTGSNNDGYLWSFEVSTEVDMTPPHIVSFMPTADSTVAPNTVVEITFSEAMDPTMASGTYSSDEGGEKFVNVGVLSGGEHVSGTATPSNAYRTVDFVTDSVCGVDPCGDSIYCLPFSSNLTAQAKAATPDDQNLPQAALLNGLTDMAGNTLDGDGDWGETGGEVGDDFVWSFNTSSEINDDVPIITSTAPSLTANEDIDVNQNVEITFNMLMWSSTLNTSNVQLVPDQDQELWYSTTKEDSASATTATISHATLWESVTDADGVITNFLYYPVITNGVKGSNQICMYPSFGPEAEGQTPGCATETSPYCCNGRASLTACVTQNLETTLGE